MSQEIISQLKKIREANSRVNADQSWVLQNKARMLSQIKNTVPEEPVRFSLPMIWQSLEVVLPGRVVYSVVRPLAVFLLVGGLALSSWIASASATQNCLPGEICYGVKMAVEKTQEVVVGVTGSSDTKTQLHLEFAKRRAEEVKKVIAQNNPDSQVQAVATIKMLEESLDVVKENFKKLSTDQPDRVAAMTQEITTKTNEIKSNLEDAKILVNDNLGKVVSETVVSAAASTTTTTSTTTVSVSSSPTVKPEVLLGEEDSKVPAVVTEESNSQTFTLDELLEKINAASAVSVQTEQVVNDAVKAAQEANNNVNNSASTTPTSSLQQ